MGESGDGWPSITLPAVLKYHNSQHIYTYTHTLAARIKSPTHEAPGYLMRPIGAPPPSRDIARSAQYASTIFFILFLYFIETLRLLLLFLSENVVTLIILCI